MTQPTTQMIEGNYTDEQLKKDIIADFTAEQDGFLYKNQGWSHLNEYDRSRIADYVISKFSSYRQSLIEELRGMKRSTVDCNDVEPVLCAIAIKEKDGFNLAIDTMITKIDNK